MLVNIIIAAFTRPANASQLIFCIIFISNIAFRTAATETTTTTNGLSPIYAMQY